ncbi:MAG: hypothetical protein ACE5FH_04130 [Candidatus Zixiibacteriota bacterium]
MSATRVSGTVPGDATIFRTDIYLSHIARVLLLSLIQQFAEVNLMKLNRIHSKSFFPPLVVFVIYLGIMLGLFMAGGGKYYSLQRALMQWDGQHYLSIARDGYVKFPCSFDRTYICGNVGWFPFYPIVASTIALSGLSINAAMLVTSWAAFAIALVLLYQLLLARFDRRVALTSLIALLLYPGSFYFLTSFPYALYLLLSITTFRLLHHGRYGWLPLPVGLLAITYPSGIVIGLPLLWILVAQWRSLQVSQRLWLSGSLASIGLTLFLYGCFYWWKFGDFFLYSRFQGQSYYAHEPAFPLTVIYETLTVLPITQPVPLMLLFAGLITAVFFTRRLPAPWQIYLFGLLLFTPTFGTTDCYYRHLVVAFPLFVLVGLGVRSKWRMAFIGVYVIAAIVLLLTVYLPAYKMGQLM